MLPSNPDNSKLETASTTAATFSSMLNDDQLTSILASQNITSPTPVQAASIPAALAGGDLIVQAQTGSGKTLAFALPLISYVRSLKGVRGTLALIVTPTRELALQVTAVIKSIAPDISPPCIIGGAKIGQQIRELREDSRIIVGTPGRLLDLMQQREILLRKCRKFVLDEADEMLSMGFIDEIREILSKLPKPRQGLFFSATITNRVRSLALSFLNKPQEIVINTETESAPDIEHLYCKVDGGITSKANALIDLLHAQKAQSAIIFCNTKSDTELVEVFLKRRGIEAAKLNSDLSQKERERIMASFRSGEVKMLIATDVAARGIDVANLDLVINYSLHDQPETYLHRTGRTGRAGRSGRAISLIGPQDFGAFYALTRTLSLGFKQLEQPVAAVA